MVMPHLTVRCVLVQEGKILLLKKSGASNAVKFHSHTNQGELWELPGGKIDIELDQCDGYLSKRTIRQAVKREIEEETGIQIKSASYNTSLKPLGIFDYSFKYYTAPRPTRVFVYGYRLPGNATVIVNNNCEDKHECFGWFSLKDLQRLEKEGKLSGNSKVFNLDLERVLMLVEEEGVKIKS